MVPHPSPPSGVSRNAGGQFFKDLEAFLLEESKDKSDITITVV
jgi:hypothetical protein